MDRDEMSWVIIHSWGQLILFVKEKDRAIDQMINKNLHPIPHLQVNYGVYCVNIIY